MVENLRFLPSIRKRKATLGTVIKKLLFWCPKRRERRAKTEKKIPISSEIPQVHE